MEINNQEKNKLKLSKREIKKWLKNHTSIICVSFAVFIVLIGFLLALFQAEEELVEFEIKDENLFTYSSFSRVEFKSEVTLDYENNVTKIIDGESVIDLFTEPIYYESQKQVIFPNNMSVIFPTEERAQRKINRYTIANGETSMVQLKNVDLQYAVEDAFIYDGFDVYFFAQPGKITYADKVVEVSSFSFVRCEYNGALAIYNYEADEMIYEEEVKGVVTAEFENYSINLAYDSIIVDGEPSLLNKNINSLKKLG